MDRIKVKITPVAPFYYASLVAMIIILIMYLSAWDLPFGSVSVLVVTALTMILAFIDYSMSYTRVKEILKKEAEAKKA